MHCIVSGFYAKIVKNTNKIRRAYPMNEKLYKSINAAAVSSLVIGICILAGGIGAGVILVVNGARLLKHKTVIIL